MNASALVIDRNAPLIWSVAGGNRISPPGAFRTVRDSLVSGGRESHPPALAGPDVTVSCHPAPTGRLEVLGSICQ